MTTPRTKFHGASYHVYSRGVDKRDLFLEENDFFKFIHCIEDSYKKFYFKIHAYCLMDNHYHFLIETPESDISEIMHLVNKKYAEYFNQKYSRTGRLFESAFKSKVVYTNQYFLNLVRYIHQNRIKSGLEENLGDWKFNSYKLYLSKQIIFNFMSFDKTLGMLDQNHNESIKKFIDFHKQKNNFHWSPLLSNPEKLFHLQKFIDQINIEKKDRLTTFILREELNLSVKEIHYILEGRQTPEAIRQLLSKMKERKYYGEYLSYLEQFKKAYDLDVVSVCKKNGGGDWI